MLIDTDLERKIGLGTRYPFESLGRGECMMHERMATALRLKEGDIFYLQVDMYQNFIDLVDIFNRDVAKPRNLTEFERTTLRPGSQDTLV